MDFGVIVRETIKRREMTQSELAQKVGLQHNTVNNYIQHKRVPPLDKAIEICQALGLELKIDGYDQKLCCMNCKYFGRAFANCTHQEKHFGTILNCGEFFCEKWEG